MRARGTPELSSSALFSMTLLRGVTRSKGLSMRWMRKAAENGDANACSCLAEWMYHDYPYAREIGHVSEAAGVAASSGGVEGHDVPPDVLNDVVHWYRKGGHDPVFDMQVPQTRVEGSRYCVNEGCEVVGHLKDFKVCPQCKVGRCRLTVAKPELKACLVSALETKM
jgi:hypothetical protein